MPGTSWLGRECWRFGILLFSQHCSLPSNFLMDFSRVFCRRFFSGFVLVPWDAKVFASTPSGAKIWGTCHACHIFENFFLRAPTTNPHPRLIFGKRQDECQLRSSITDNPWLCGLLCFNLACVKVSPRQSDRLPTYFFPSELECTAAFNALFSGVSCHCPDTVWEECR